MIGRKTKIKFLYLLIILSFSEFAFGYSVLIDGTTYHFEYKRTVTIQSGQVAGSLTNFPTLFNSTTKSGLPADLKVGNGGKVRNPNGDDIVFALDDDEEIYKCEIEYYDDGTGEYIAWVRIPTIANGIVFYLYYGCDDAISFPANFTTDVWSNNFRAVYHLKETTGGSGAIKDSTANGMHGTDNNNPSLGQGGKIHYAIDFDGNQNQSISIPYYNLGTVFNYSMWFKRGAAGNLEPFSFMRTGIRINDAAGAPANSIQWWPNLSIAPENATWTPDTNWNYLVINQWMSGTPQCSIYLNGSVIHGPEQSNAVNTTNSFNYIGRIGLAADWTGLIDEVRISDWSRGGGWAWTEWNNQNAPGSFYTVGDPWTTLVELFYFRATSLDSAVLLEWATETELDNAGFNLWRSEEKDVQYVRINPYFIPAEGEAGFGAEYSFTDYDVQNGKTYYYKLEDIDVYGNSTFHGPVPATPNDIIPIWPPDWEVLPSEALLLSWASSGNSSFKVEISPSPSFLNSETLSFPKQGWITANSLWLAPKDWAMVLRKAQQSGGQMFWRVRAKSQDGRVVYSEWRRFGIAEPLFPED